MRLSTVAFSFLVLGCLAGLVRAFTPSENGLYAVFDTSAGEMAARLHYESVPSTVANFVMLAEGDAPFFDPVLGGIVLQPYYDESRIDAVESGRRVQIGGSADEHSSRSAYAFLPEIVDSLRHGAAGVLSMEDAAFLAGPDSDGTRFSISLDALPERDGRNAVFGAVVEGLPVLSALNPDSIIHAVTIVREGLAAMEWDPADYSPKRFESLGIALDARTDVEGVSLQFLQRPGTLYRVQTSTDFSNWATLGHRDTRTGSHATRPTGLNRINLGASVVPGSGSKFFRIDERISTEDKSGYSLLIEPDPGELSTIIVGLEVTRAEISMDFNSSSGGAYDLQFNITIFGTENRSWDVVGSAQYQWYELPRASVLDLRIISGSPSIPTVSGFSPVQPQQLTLRFTEGDAVNGGRGIASIHYYPLTGAWEMSPDVVASGAFQLIRN